MVKSGGNHAIFRAGGKAGVGQVSNPSCDILGSTIHYGMPEPAAQVQSVAIKGQTLSIPYPAQLGIPRGRRIYGTPRPHRMEATKTVDLTCRPSTWLGRRSVDRTAY